MVSRRDFVKQGLLPVLAGSAVPSIFANGVAAAAADAPRAAASNDRVLVLVQLAGGNDGLNTLIPYQDGAYHDARPTLRQEEGVLALNNQLGLHPNLKGLKASWDAGQLAIVQGVGYPNPNLSHFVSMSIWETANVQGGIAGAAGDAVEDAGDGAAVAEDLPAATGERARHAGGRGKPFDEVLRRL